MNDQDLHHDSLIHDEAYWQALLQEDEQEAERKVRKDEKRPWQPDGAFTTEDEYQSFGEGKDILLAEGSRDLASSAIEDEEKDWQEVQEYFVSEQILEAPVTGYNRGGILVKLGNLQGFVPASHLLGMPRWVDDTERAAELAARVGTTMPVKIIELDRARNRVILSERAVSEEDEKGDMVLRSLAPGDVRRGRVSNLCDFGAFVDLGGIDGLIHVSELSWDRVEHPRDMLRSGDEVEVYVLEVDRSRRRIALSLKRLQPNPWDTVEQKYEIGQLVEGTVTNVVDFGAFVRVENGLEGLIHISELAEGNFLHPRNVVQEGDRVTVRILNIDGENHRLGLSLKQAWSRRDDEKPLYRNNQG
ncbi:MAG: 30S ribosomal protein S1 [Anaerolineae bacterium]